MQSRVPTFTFKGLDQVSMGLDQYSTRQAPQRVGRSIIPQIVRSPTKGLATCWFIN